MTIKTKEEFTEFADEYWSWRKKPYAFGVGLNYFDSDGHLVATKFITVNVESNYGVLAAIWSNRGEAANTCIIEKKYAREIIETYFSPFVADKKGHANIDALRAIDILAEGRVFDTTCIQGVLYVCQSRNDLLNTNISCIEDAHFRLALISRLHFKPNEQCLDGIFGILQNAVYTNKGCHSILDWNRNRILLQSDGEQVLCQDKFPPYFWANPAIKGVRIANADMVRDGAHIVPDTTVMHYGSPNFNSGTLGKSIIEGRIPHGVTIGKGSDLGAGCGLLGTLSGGNSVTLSVGENSLIGANAECGVVLGDNCKVTTGTCFGQSTPCMEMIPIYHREGGKITSWEELGWKKAEEFNGVSNLTFRQNSKTGRMEVLHIGNKVELNEELHKND